MLELTNSYDGYTNIYWACYRQKKHKIAMYSVTVCALSMIRMCNIKPYKPVTEFRNIFAEHREIKSCKIYGMHHYTIHIVSSPHCRQMTICVLYFFSPTKLVGVPTKLWWRKPFSLKLQFNGYFCKIRALENPKKEHIKSSNVIF